MSEIDLGHYARVAREHADGGDLVAAIAVLEEARRDERLPAFLRQNLGHTLSHYRTRLQQSAALPEPVRRIGVICPQDRTKGLFRDWETILWALSGDETWEVSGLVVPGSLYGFDYAASGDSAFRIMRSRGGQATESYSGFREWIASLDCLFVLEVMNESLLAATRGTACEHSVLYLPNLEWAVCDPKSDDCSRWIHVLREQQERIVTIARARSIQDKLRSLGIGSVELPWSVPDEVIARPNEPESPLRVLMNCGNFGYKDRRGFDIAYRALETLADAGCRLSVTLKANRSFDAPIDKLRSEALKIEVITEFFADRRDVLALYDRSDVVVYPSRFEGLGLGILEAMHRGAMILVTDGNPMKDLVPSSWPKIEAVHTGQVRLADCYEPSADKLARLLADLAARPGDIPRPSHAAMAQRQAAFRQALTSLTRSVMRDTRLHTRQERGNRGQ